MESPLVQRIIVLLILSAFPVCYPVPDDSLALVALANSLQLEPSGTESPYGTVPLLPDTTPPTFSGALNAVAVDSGSIQLSWSAASDDQSTADAITYNVCRSSAAGICQGSFATTTAIAAGKITHTFTGLNGDTAYYFVVRAQDEAGNVETNTIEVSGKTSPVYLYSTTSFNGDLRTHGGGTTGREGADNLCSNRKNAAFASLACTNIRAFLSTNGGDTIAAMATNYNVPTTLPFRDPTNTHTVGDDWADMTDGTIDISISAAGINSGAYWTASDQFGNQSNSCGGFTNSSFSGRGRRGFELTTLSQWLNSNLSTCNSTLEILCVCW